MKNGARWKRRKQWVLVLLISMGWGCLPLAADEPSVAVEELTFEVPAALRAQFLRLDAEIWTPVLARQAGFLSKETLVTQKKQTTVKLLVHWENKTAWDAVPKKLLKATEAAFAKAMGGPQNYKLVSVKAYSRVRFVPSVTADQPDRAESVSLDLTPLQTEQWQKRAREIVVAKDPTFKKRKRYLAVDLLEYLEDRIDLETLHGTTVVFECSDGYRPTMDGKTIASGGGWLAIRDLDAPDGLRWSPPRANGRTSKLEPCYLVWPDVSGWNNVYAWPYALTQIHIEQEDLFKAMAFPRNAKQHQDGFEAFKIHCAKCHAMNGAGGVLGPELNYPKNVTEYWRHDVLKKFVRNPGDFRRGSKMPSLAYLEDATLDSILDYLQYMTNEKRSRDSAP